MKYFYYEPGKLVNTQLLFVISSGDLPFLYNSPQESAMSLLAVTSAHSLCLSYLFGSLHLKFQLSLSNQYSHPWQYMVYVKYLSQNLDASGSPTAK